MRRLFSLFLCLIMLCTSTFAEAAGTAEPFTGLYGLIKAVRSMKGGTIAVEIPGMEPLALTLDPQRADFARMDLPGGALFATAQGLFLRHEGDVRGVQWGDLLDAAGISLEELAETGEALLADVQTVGEALVKEYRLRTPVFAAASGQSDFISASARMDASALMQIVENVITDEYEAVDRILEKVGPMLFGGRMTAARLLNDMQMQFYRSGLGSLGEVFSMSYGASMVDDECAVTLLAKIGPAQLTVTVQDGKLSGELCDEDGHAVLTISGAMVIEDGMHANLVIAPVIASTFTPIRLHLAVNGRGFSALVTGEEFSLSAALGEDNCLNISLRAGGERRGVKFDLTVADNMTHLGFSAPGFTLDAAYEQELVWVADADHPYGGYYLTRPELSIKSEISSTKLNFETNSEGVTLQIIDRGSLHSAFQYETATQAIKLRWGDTLIDFTPREAPAPGEILANLQVTTEDELHLFTLHGWSREGIPCIDVQQGGETLLTIVVDLEGKYLPDEPAGMYAVTEPEDFVEAIEAWIEEAGERLLALGEEKGWIAEPTEAPTAVPTAVPTATPTAEPTAVPTATPTVEPTAVPTAVPTFTPVPNITSRSFEAEGREVASLRIPDGFSVDYSADQGYNDISLLNSYYEPINAIYAAVIEGVTSQQMLATMDKYNFYDEQTAIRNATIGGKKVQYRYVRDTFVDDYGFKSYYSALIIYKDVTDDACFHLTLSSRYEAEKSILPSEQELLDQAQDILSCVTLN